MLTGNALAAVLALLAVQSCVVEASTGDDLEEYQDCWKLCDIVTCNNRASYPDVEDPMFELMMKDQQKTGRFEEMPMAWNLRFLGWKCYDNCDYQCQRMVTQDRQAKGKEVVQFHGKWPFIRAFGMQELFSTLFSIGNFFPHYWGFETMWRHYQKEMGMHGDVEAAHAYWAYLIVGLVASCAWVSSALFHLKDTWTREQLDYYFAGMTVVSALYAVGMRYFHLYLTKNDSKRIIFGAVVILIYLGHVTRLVCDWSYTYNMRANVTLGLLEDVLWVAHALTTFREQRVSKSLLKDLKNPKVNWTLIPIVLVISVSMGMTFELFDFPPMFDLLDAHAMWHLCTIWPAIYWYPYMVRDVESGVKEKKFE
ncbi:hypothetical protein FOA43_001190 [Brettanomyces nanus]|uniref:Post-GPI attachment to proteins factor 3 n=1 Tax=Eeniella nana TaxID=13502 RepID=A0A875S0M2_EENNA|nr:uncharacterized protein FOA43_001190 [Brettanomyces nanus]QPG73875.1 hypothetical protein FOA43_001190 [Brettanomyces nanus]